MTLPQVKQRTGIIILGVDGFQRSGGFGLVGLEAFGFLALQLFCCVLLCRPAAAVMSHSF